MGKCLIIMYPESVKENKNLPKLGFTSIRCKPTPELIGDFRSLDGISLDKAKELFAEGEEGQEIIIYNNRPAIKFSKEDDTKILIADNMLVFYPNKLLNINLEDFSGLVNLKQLGGRFSDETSYTGDISGIKTLTSLTSLNLGSTSVTGDISGIKTLTSLTSLSLGSTSVTGDISGIKTLTSLTSLSLGNTPVTGDISGIKTLTSLTSLYLGETSVTGDISGIKTLTSLISLNLDGTPVTGDISGIKTLTSLTWLDLGGTLVTGDISGIKTLTSLTSLYLRGTSVTGDISGLTNLLAVGLNGTSMRWSSSSARSSKTNIPLGMNDSSMSKDYCNFGSDLDNFLIDEAACTNFSGNSKSKKILAKGTRTSASDAAIKTLQDNGWTVSLQSE